MKKTQRNQNPYKNSDSNKRYYTYEYYLRSEFGSKVAKIPLDIYPTIKYGDYANIIRNEIINTIQYTSKNDVLRDDGSIGTLKISEIGLNVKVYDGTTSNSMKKGVGHFAETSYWNGNIGLAGHNRGVNDNFGKLKKLSKGDIITYKTELGTRKYEVFYVGQIGVTDLSRLNPSSENMITLITCVENQPLLRLCVQAKELK